MERLQQLINQLQEQHDRKVDPSQMLQTIRLLEAELALLSTQAAVSKGSAKVAVMMPSSMKIYSGHAAMQEVRTAAVGAGAAASVAAPPVVNVPPPPAPEVRLAPDPGNPPRPAAKDPEKGPWPYDPLAEIPTLLAQQQKQPRELNDVIGNNGSSLNDKLRTDRLELKSALNDTPVRDLKKAIGVNDRFVFISQLFRGDEVMYERSLKTINGFRILPEAEYWMERELKVKLGWDETRETVKHFYQLVKRRFS
ncbi:hypothetical protein Q4E93_01480 [Flavitalea sp. BT771]|uniref:hypothetical protein n=1 Tax=Flavitalea sp. BT771 TaxID=3063329 RepID=UPI0026E17063|nr:hypothetical protein [Flavitalea sp. BT771]MDO6429239.1 hypothetical protein [Flavitalea sp. BT771]MDV6218633.1 hypothetical protein [Flavitalea sp. BT771]